MKRRRAYLDIVTAAAAAYRVKLLAWSVLPKALWLVAVPPDAAALGAFMRVAQTRYTRCLHADGYDGETTSHRFASCPLDTVATQEAIGYVESLAVREKLAAKPADYAFSSAANGRAKKAASLAPERVDYLLMRLRTGKPVGEPAFIHRVERKVGMNLSRRRGRPAKNGKVARKPARK